MSTSKRNVTREVLLERERGKAGASWLAGGQYAHHVVVLRELTQCMRGQRSSFFCYFYFFMSGERRASEAF